ncbi:MAG: hypothetical protein KIS94_00640 [Chitinophagales bacterium]|nr:hypothetical protein [Chitinophagales bacterium]
MKSGVENVFVFVVCGSVEHIDALHFSIKALRNVSDAEIVVVTDTSRNEAAVQHPNLIDVKTPAHFTHHQASIFLKTGLHKYLPVGNLYCYLDTDVIALDEKVNEIFAQFNSPITFAKDHCLMDRFSPSAISCNCKKEFDEWEAELKALFVRYKDLSRIPEDKEKKERLLKKFEEIKKDKLHYAFTSVRFWLTRKTFRFDDDTFYDKENFVWHDKNYRPIIFEKDVGGAIEAIEQSTTYRCNRENTRIWTRNGKNVFDCRCNHLQEQIEKDFGIVISEPEWQHWNGGVFLFNEKSIPFLNAWHNKTIRIFGLPNWKTRDQGTLIATAWEFGLQHAHILPVEFNLIADYEHRHMTHLGNLQFTFGENTDILCPHFVHVYHHWGDKSWDVWNAIEQKTGINFSPSPSA